MVPAIFLFYISLFFMAVVTQVVIPIPLDLVILGLVGSGHSYLAVVAVATVGLTVGASLDFLFGKVEMAKIPWLHKRQNTKLYKRAEKIYKKAGQWTLLFSSIPVVGKYFPLIAGVMEERWYNFVMIYVLGKIGYYGLIYLLLNGLLKLV